MRRRTLEGKDPVSFLEAPNLFVLSPRPEFYILVPERAMKRVRLIRSTFHRKRRVNLLDSFQEKWFLCEITRRRAKYIRRCQECPSSTWHRRSINDLAACLVLAPNDVCGVSGAGMKAHRRGKINSPSSSIVNISRRDTESHEDSRFSTAPATHNSVFWPSASHKDYHPRRGGP